MAVAEYVLRRKVTNLDEALRLLTESGRPVLLEAVIEGKPTRGVLIDYEDYRGLLQRLEGLEDLQAMRESEAEYRAWEGRPFSEIVAEIESKGGDVQG